MISVIESAVFVVAGLALILFRDRITKAVREDNRGLSPGLWKRNIAQLPFTLIVIGVALILIAILSLGPRG